MPSRPCVEYVEGVPGELMPPDAFTARPSGLLPEQGHVLGRCARGGEARRGLHEIRAARGHDLGRQPLHLVRKVRGLDNDLDDHVVQAIVHGYRAYLLGEARELVGDVAELSERNFEMFMTTSSSEAPLVTASRTAAIFTAVGSYPKGKETTVATFTSAPRNSLAARGT